MKVQTAIKKLQKMDPKLDLYFADGRDRAIKIQTLSKEKNTNWEGEPRNKPFACFS